MMRYAAKIAVLVAAVALGGIATGAMADASEVSDLFARCQNEDTAAKARVELCSKLIDDKSLDAGLRAEALLARGIVREDLNEDAAALDDYTKAIELNPEYPALFSFRGSLYEKLGRYEEAVKDTNEVLRLQPGDADALHTRARSYHILGNLDGALADYMALVEKDPKDAEALIGRASVREDLGKTAEAIADFQSALAIDPQNEDAKEGLSRLRGG